MKSNFYFKRMRQLAFIVLFSSLPLVSVAQTSSPKKGKCKECDAVMHIFLQKNLREKGTMRYFSPLTVNLYEQCYSMD